MSWPFRFPDFGFVLAAIVAASSVDCSGQQCSGALCYDGATVTASMPYIAAATWTVTVCQNADCSSADISATNPDVYATPLGLTITYSQQADGWILRVAKQATSPKNGDIWSLRVTDQTGAVVFENGRAVTYADTGDDCQRCKAVVVDF